MIPDPTRDLQQARQDLADHGLCLIADALDSGELAAVRSRLYEAADEDSDSGRGYLYDNDGTNQRVWALVKRGQEFVDLVRNPIALEMIEHLLDSPFLLSNISANITGPGGGRMHLHPDQGYVIDPFPPVPLAANAMWFIDDFDESVGATQIVPGSHRIDHSPTREERRAAATLPVEAPAGTLGIMDGRVWHQTGENKTIDRHRAGIFAYYVRPFLRTQENWWRSLSPEQLVEFSNDDTMHMLLGFDQWQSLGVVDGMPLDAPRY